MVRVLGVGMSEIGVGTEGVDEVGHEVLFAGAGLDNFFFVFDDNFVIGDFDDFAAMDSELRIDKRFDGGTFDDDLLNYEIF